MHFALYRIWWDQISDLKDWGIIRSRISTKSDSINTKHVWNPVRNHDWCQWTFSGFFRELATNLFVSGSADELFQDFFGIFQEVPMNFFRIFLGSFNVPIGTDQKKHCRYYELKTKKKSHIDGMGSRHPRPSLALINH